MNLNLSYARTLEHFKVGQVFRHLPHKTVTESDNNMFCLLTMCHHPIHCDVEFARQSQHGQLLVVGTYVFSLIAAMTVPDISGAAIANLEYEKIEHNGPVFVGDTLRSETEVLDVRPSKSKPDRGIVYVETRGFNQRNERILTFRRRVLIRTEMPESYNPNADN